MANATAPIMSRFLRREDGGMTILGLYFFLFAAILSALALDSMSIYTARTHLQVTADSAAHAAIYTRNMKNFTADEAKAAALEVIETGMPADDYGEVATTARIYFGTYDTATGIFVDNPNSLDAVRVITSMDGGNGDGGNALATYLFKLVGIDDFDLATEAIYTSITPPCLREGFVSQTRTDIQSNNTFSKEFCVHSNGHVEMNNGNRFELGTSLSMPDPEDLVAPNIGQNPGAEEALRRGTLRLDVLDQIADMKYAYLNPLASDHSPLVKMPDYIKSPVVVSLESGTFVATDLLPGVIYDISCGSEEGLLQKSGGNGDKSAPKGGGNGNGGGGNGGGGNGGGGNNTLTLTGSDIFKEMVIVTDCDVVISGGTELHDVRLITTSTSASSVSGSSGVILGDDDDCAKGGGVEIYTYGGMRFPAKLNLYGTQLGALGDINFAANANGVEGASLIAGGEIDGTSNAKMGLCLNDGRPDGFFQPYFRLVR